MTSKKILKAFQRKLGPQHLISFVSHLRGHKGKEDMSKDFQIQYYRPLTAANCSRKKKCWLLTVKEN